MKALTCEMCGSTDIIKKDGLFVCQSCGTKYSVEEAKKMMVEGTVDVSGTVKVDTSDELKNLYEIARRAKDTDNSENAAKYYDQILVKDPSSWEANFYVVYFKAMSCKIAEIQSAAMSITNCLAPVVDLIKANIPEENQGDIINELFHKCSSISSMLFDAAENHYNNIDYQIRDQYTQEFCYNAFASSQIMYYFGDLLEVAFNERFGGIAAIAWEEAIGMHNRYIKYLVDKESNKKTIMSYSEKIKKYDPEFKTPEVNTSSSGCYVATAVYGSYDCPEVWTLRRFRDFQLAETWHGRLFIKMYYAVSPTIVRWFGKTNWFKKFWKSKLDNFVSELQSEGVKNTPYDDKVW